MSGSPRLGRLNDPAPHARLLSNGRYSVLITGAGTGFSSCDGYALTSWNADRTEDGDGFFAYLRDVDRGTLWSTGHQPVQTPAARAAVGYEPGTFRINRLDDGIETRLDVCVASAADMEIRRLCLRNDSDQPRRIEVTTYAEVVLNDWAAHAAHPAFSKLFVQTDYVAEAGALLAKRRPRSGNEITLWMVHAMSGAISGSGSLQHETDRARFVGRGHTLARPRALVSAEPLSGTTGNVLDPIFSLRRTVVLPAGASSRLVVLLGAAETRESALALVAGCSDPTAVDSLFERAVESERALIVGLGLDEQQAELFQELAGAILYGHPALRAAPGIVRPGRQSTTDLSRRGLSGRPIVVVEAEAGTDWSRVRDLLRAYVYWRGHGFNVDLVILADDLHFASQEVARLLQLHQDTRSRAEADRVHVWRPADIPPDELAFIRASADAVIPTAAAIEDVLANAHESSAGLGRDWRMPAAATENTPRAGGGIATEPLRFDNGQGGFNEDGSEYVIRVHPGNGSYGPPMPWINVVANETFGFLISERGAGYTWSGNSRENRLTPWYNDPICDPYGEALYIRDDDTMMCWSPLPGPSPQAGPYEVHHGFGYTTCRHTGNGVAQDVCLFVPRQHPVKITRVRLRNTTSRARRVSVVCYNRLVLGVVPSQSAPSVITELDAETGAILARNPLNNEFSNRVVFVAAVVPADTTGVSFTGDRTAFIGRNGAPDRPAALRRSVLDGKTGARLDPCGALQLPLVIPAGETIECTFLLGEGTDSNEARRLIRHYREPGAVERSLQAVRSFWRETLSAVQVGTPSAAIDLMVNGWLLYQDLSCRLWGRSALYQSGGAFGFRDQLQDAAALIYTRPDLTRAQILEHAAHQFVEGDVLHWWHPPTSRGIRTRFSDDLVWLPYLTAFYVHTTGDGSVLDEPADFVTARALAPGEDEAYLFPQASGETENVYTHCCRALDRSLPRGAHGLPLMGTGDWNDGMNRVGREGRGESVWMGFFLYRTLGDFVPICERRGDHERARRYRAHQMQLKAAVNDAGWDGQWYRRAYYDDGTPLGSASNDECRIDALAQAWAVISQAAPLERAWQAMDAVEQQLIVEDAGLIRLLTPPFDVTSHDPGYIKGYVPGIRENGGQYTHAAIWAVRAIAELGRRNRAASLLEMLTPVRHARSAPDVAVYQVEPYVVAADVYGVDPHLGRGGWTWYTGSAGWMYRVALESLLGVTLENGHTLRIKPCIPDHWPQFTVRYRLGDRRTRYEITVLNPSGKAAAVESVDIDERPGVVEEGAARIPLAEDGAAHQVSITLGK
jgi:cellobiose phosphorylase